MLLKRFLLIVFLLSSFSACGVLKSSKAEYERSETDVPLEIPEGLKKPESDAALVVP